MRTKLFWIDGPWTGRLAIAPRPRGGEWLQDEVESWRLNRVDVVLSLLTPGEITEFTLEEERELCRKNEIQFLSFPVSDRDVPSSGEAFSGLVTNLAEGLAEGKTVAVHCRQGIGRAGLVAIGLLTLSGVDLPSAIQRVSAARGCAVPETPEQLQWITEFAKTVMTPISK